ncbi:hypothetical protein MRB53_010386 [Persea americana]|uniref:Uncharacterized protein n=1 Tax=Persea americana TaxID=3435 RepID=A0ACC2LSV5_PERAE|nr:hypothetical protein MRB53_010386 [Persea americana]
MESLPSTSTGNCVIALCSLLLLTSINLMCFVESATLLKKESDRLVLLAFKDGISEDPNGILSSWNDSQHFSLLAESSEEQPQRPHPSVAREPFITHKSLSKFLSLYGNNLIGEIQSDIGSLSKLYWLSLQRNDLNGHIPPSLGNLSSLTNLYLSENSLDGSIPQELGDWRTCNTLQSAKIIIWGFISEATDSLEPSHFH